MSRFGFARSSMAVDCARNKTASLRGGQAPHNNTNTSKTQQKGRQPRLDNADCDGGHCSAPRNNTRRKSPGTREVAHTIRQQRPKQSQTQHNTKRNATQSKRVIATLSSFSLSFCTHTHTHTPSLSLSLPLSLSPSLSVQHVGYTSRQHQRDLRLCRHALANDPHRLCHVSRHVQGPSPREPPVSTDSRIQEMTRD